jgi:hypothetical protein
MELHHQAATVNLFLRDSLGDNPVHELGHQLYAIPSDAFSPPNREKTPLQLLVIVQPPSTATGYRDGPSWRKMERSL